MSNDALFQAAITAARAGDLDEAAVLFARLVKEEPTSEQGWLGLGFCFTDKKQREYCFQRVLTINPNNIQAKQALGLLENSGPVETPTNLRQPSQVSATDLEQSLTKPSVSPFFSEYEPAPEPSEPVFMPTGKPKAVANNTTIE